MSLQPLTQNTVYPATDKELRDLVFRHEKVIVKFTTKDCPVCLRMWKHFLAMSQEPQYRHIRFLMMDSAENPVSRKSVQLSGTPFFAIYRNGMLRECKLVDNETELEAFINKLTT